MARFFGICERDERLDFAHERPNNNAMHHLHSGMIYEVGSMGFFAAFRIILAFFGAPDYFVAVGDGIFQGFLLDCKFASE